MALIFMDGFDHYGFNDIPRKWTARDSTSNYANDIRSTSGRRGGGAFMVGSNGGIYKNIPARSTLILGVAINAPTMPDTGGGQPLFELRDGATQQLYVFLDTTAKLRVLRGGGTLLGISDVPLPLGSWQYLEFKATIDNSLGSYELRVNGVTWLSASGVDTQNTANAFANYLCLGITGSNDANVYYDDFYLCDTSGASNTDFLGDIRIDTLYPSGPGSYQNWVPSTGTDHAAMIDETSPNTVDYLSGTTPGQKETLSLADLPVNGSVLGVQLNNYVAKADAGLAKVQNLLRSGENEVTGPVVALSTSYVYSVSLHETDPATGLPWTTAGVNALEAGIVVSE